MHMEKGISDERDNETTDEDSDFDVTLQEVGVSSDDDESDSVNDEILLPRNS